MENGSEEHFARYEISQDRVSSVKTKPFCIAGSLKRGVSRVGDALSAPASVDRLLVTCGDDAVASTSIIMPGHASWLIFTRVCVANHASSLRQSICVVGPYLMS